jgi:chemotaxis signal transduction protein
MRVPDAQSIRQVVRIDVDDVQIAVDAAVVRDILGALAVTYLPGGPHGLVGVVPWNGRAVAVLDLASLLGSSSAIESRPRTILVETETATIAIPIDRVHEPCRVDAERDAHAARIAHARIEIDVAGTTLPLFDLTEYARSFEPHP